VNSDPSFSLTLKFMLSETWLICLVASMFPENLTELDVYDALTSFRNNEDLSDLALAEAASHRAVQRKRQMYNNKLQRQQHQGEELF
jgi:hypothetical protein